MRRTLLLLALLVSFGAYYYTITPNAPGTWRPAGRLERPRRVHHVAELADGRVLVVGGYDGTEALREVEVFDPATLSWSRAADLHVPRVNHSLTRLPDGRVLACGGQSTLERLPPLLADCELYDPAADRWTRTSTMSPRRIHDASVLPDGRVLVTGGDGPGGRALASAELYDPARDRWTELPPLPEPRFGHHLLPTERGALVIGGSYDERLRQLFPAPVVEWDGAEWTTVAELEPPPQRGIHLSDERRFVIIEEFPVYGVPAPARVHELRHDGTLSPLGLLPEPRQDMAAAFLADGRVLLIGGKLNLFENDWLTRLLDDREIPRVAYGQFELRVEYYDGAWKRSGDTLWPRDGHRALALRDGRVLVVGGGDFKGLRAEAEIWSDR